MIAATIGITSSHKLFQLYAEKISCVLKEIKQPFQLILKNIVMKAIFDIYEFNLEKLLGYGVCKL